MAKEYYYFISGLPTLNLEDSKLVLTPLMFFHNAKDYLNHEDYELLRLMLIPNDLTNLINTLHSSNNWLDESLITKEQWQELYKSIKQDPDSIQSIIDKADKDIPYFVISFLHKEAMNLELTPKHIMFKDLFTLFYDMIEHKYSGFVKEWFNFESNLKNILIAINCRKHNLPVQDQLVGNSLLTEKLIKSTAGDFGLGSDFPIYDIINRINDNPDIIEKEKGIDALRWKWLENRIFFDYFTIPRILAYFAKLRIIYRWIHLSQAVGEKRFHQVLNDLETSFEFPEEFALKR
jgi:hypothetical protein